jgi:hypothetical protein
MSESTAMQAENDIMVDALNDIAAGEDVEQIPLLARLMHANTMQAHAIGQQMDEWNQKKIKELEAEVKYWKTQFYTARTRVMDLFDAPPGDMWDMGE